MPEFYFFRQKFVGGLCEKAESFESRLMPELKPVCVCQRVLNVDEEAEECPNCKAYFHPICMRQHSDRRCFDCKQELPKKLIYSHKREETNETLELKLKLTEKPQIAERAEQIMTEKVQSNQTSKDPFTSI